MESSFRTLSPFRISTTLVLAAITRVTPCYVSLPLAPSVGRFFAAVLLLVLLLLVRLSPFSRSFSLSVHPFLSLRMIPLALLESISRSRYPPLFSCVLLVALRTSVGLAVMRRNIGPSSVSFHLMSLALLLAPLLFAGFLPFPAPWRGTVAVHLCSFPSPFR